MNGFKPSRDPIVWSFLLLLASTMVFSIVSAIQNHRITTRLTEVLATQKSNQDHLDYLHQAFLRREAELKIEREAKKSAVNP